ncbi:hypothetical protein [Enterovibrio coralii]|uniref:hypothetical protein n=1 Tax=Enterovibrio coralii TaxID=294935 RepID=UPI000B23F732|nr:hypothetical protein [Enterovibrio coralii]
MPQCSPPPSQQSFFRQSVNNVITIITQTWNLLVRWILSLFETGEITMDLESIGESPEQAKAMWRNNRAAVIAMAERNQIKLEQALRLRDRFGELVPPTKERFDFNVVMGKGYFPILGNLLIPVGAGTFRGQGCYVRRKALPSAFKGVTTHPTALCPIGGSDNNGILTQCGSSRVFDFAISGCLKGEGDGGNGMIFGHTPPEPEAVGSAKPNVAQYWAGQPNRMPEKRFGAPQVWLGLTSFELRNDKAQTVITVPAKGTYSNPKDVLLDDTVDIPLVRWVRAFDASGKEVARYANSGKKLDGKLVALTPMTAKRRGGQKQKAKHVFITFPSNPQTQPPLLLCLWACLPQRKPWKFRFTTS